MTEARKSFTLTIRARIIFMSVLLVSLTAGALGIQQHTLAQEREAIAKQRSALQRLKDLTAIFREFGKFRNSSFDMALTRRKESRSDAEAAQERLAGHLQPFLSTDRSWADALQRHLSAISAGLRQAVRLYEGGDTDQGNAAVAGCGQAIQEAGQLIEDSISSQQILAEAAGKSVEEIGESATRTSLLLLVISTLLGILLALATLRSFSAPLARMSRAVAVFGTGDFTVKVESGTGDEFGQLTDVLRAMQRDLRTAVGSISQNAMALSEASRRLTAVAEQMSANAEETSAQISSLAASSEQVNRNLDAVAASAQEMNTSIRSIAVDAGEAGKTAQGAVSIVEAANGRISALGQSGVEIGNVIKIITSIAEQTNLLALNATIEAARAGDVGRGFAVVAGEVKDLARRTGKATDEVRSRIEVIQAGTQASAESMGSVTEIIGKIRARQETIGISVEEQTATTREITRMFGEMARTSSEISRNLTGVAQAARSTSEGAAEARKAADALAALASALMESISRFKW